MKKLLFPLLAIALAFGLALPMATPVSAATVDVNVGESIQAAVDSASPGDVVIVHAGTYDQSVVFGSEDSGITLKGEEGAILDGTGLAAVDAIRLLAGVSDVTIEGFEIRNYTGTGNGQGNAIQAWNSGTSNIIIQNNVMHDNSWNAVLVGNEGQGLHIGWKIRNNTVYDNGFYGLELTNAQDSEIRGNSVRGGWTGILVQARNTIPNSGTITVSNIRVMRNTVSDAGIGTYILAMASGPTPPFPPITGAWVILEDVMFTGNQVNGSSGTGVWVYGYLGGHVTNARVIHNAFTDFDLGVGIAGTTNAKVVNNAFTNCDADVADYGDETKIPPYGSP